MNKEFKSPLYEMTKTTPTEFWNDSCSISELEYAIEHGGVGATTNPVIVGDVLKNEMNRYKGRIKEMIQEMPEATEDDIAWKLNEEMAIEGAKLLLPIYEESKGQKGRISIQTNTKYYRNAKLLMEQALRFDKLAPNIQVKMPTTKAGIEAFEEATYKGISINATVSFTVPQAIAVAEAVERGLKRREAEGKDTSWMHPVCTIMIGRTDDWMKVIVDRDDIILDAESLEWAGIAVMKNAYRIYKERGFRTQLLAAAYRNVHHWTEFIGGDIAMTIPPRWIKRFVNSDVKVQSNIDKPVDYKYIEQLSKYIPDFVKAYQPDGMTVEQFETYGATSRTLLQFFGGYDDLIKMIRNMMIVVK